MSGTDSTIRAATVSAPCPAPGWRSPTRVGGERPRGGLPDARARVGGERPRGGLPDARARVGGERPRGGLPDARARVGGERPRGGLPEDALLFIGATRQYHRSIRNLNATLAKLDGPHTAARRRGE